MNDEILVEYKGLSYSHGSPIVEYKITSHAHHDAMAMLKGVNTGGEARFTNDDLEAFKKLGYAVCNNTLDCHGRKVYIHHNARTFKEKKRDLKE